MPNISRVSAGVPSGGQFAGITRDESDNLNPPSAPEPEITYHPDGTILSERYFRSRQLDRDDGPAKIYYRSNGTIEHESYHRNGEEYFLGEEDTTTDDGYW